MANGTRYGLAAAIWSRDIKRVHYVAKKLRAGSIYVNRYFPPGIEAPAGGYKQSGFGRADGLDVVKEYTQVKNVTICLD